jgi:hypothetical protein
MCIFRFKKKNDKNKRDIKKGVRRAVAKTDRGNLYLMRERYITQEDIEKLRKRNLAHDFTKSK